MRKLFALLLLVICFPLLADEEVKKAEDAPPSPTPAFTAVANGLPPELQGPQYKGAIHVARGNYTNIGLGIGAWEKGATTIVHGQWLCLDHVALGVLPIYITTMGNAAYESVYGGMITASYYGFGNRPFGGVVVHTGFGVIVPNGSAFKEKSGILRGAAYVGIGWAFAGRGPVTLDVSMAGLFNNKPETETASLTGTVPMLMLKLGYRI